MRVTDLLRGKGHEVTTMSPGATLHTAARVLSEGRIGAVVVSNDGRTIDGILSERDIVRLVANEGPAALELPVRSAMTERVRTCRGTDSVEDLMREMTEHRIRHLPVVDDDGNLTGIVSIGDVVKHRVETLEDERRLLTDYIQTGR